MLSRLLQPFHVYCLRAFLSLLDAVGHANPVGKIWRLSWCDACAVEKDLLTIRVNNESITLLWIIPLDVTLIWSRSKFIGG